METTIQHAPSHVKFSTVKEYQSSNTNDMKTYFGTLSDRRNSKSHNRTGKNVSTILADQGDHVTLIADHSYLNRHLGCDVKSRRPIKGLRPMHKSTLIIPTQKYTDYLTSSKRVSKIMFFYQ